MVVCGYCLVVEVRPESVAGVNSYTTSVICTHSVWVNIPPNHNLPSTYTHNEGSAVTTALYKLPASQKSIICYLF